MDALHSTIFRAMLPGWFYSFSSLIKVPYLSARALHSQLAFDDLRIHMADLVASARAESIDGERSGASGRSLLRNLVKANTSKDGSSEKLTEGEIFSNIFVSTQLIFTLCCSAIPLYLGFSSRWTRLVDLMCLRPKLMSGRRDHHSYTLLCICLIGPLPRVAEKSLRRGGSGMARGCPRHTINNSEHFAIFHELALTNAKRISTRITKNTWTNLSDFRIFSANSVHTDSLQRSTLWHAFEKHFASFLPNHVYQKMSIRIPSYLALISPLDRRTVLPSKLTNFRWRFRRGVSSSWMYGHCTITVRDRRLG